MTLARSLNICFLTCKMQVIFSTSLLSPCCKNHNSLAKLTVNSEVLYQYKAVLLMAFSSLFLPLPEESSLINYCVSLGRVTPGQLMSYIQLFKNNFKALVNHCGLLQLGLATVQTLKHPQTAKWDNFLAFERLLLQVCCYRASWDSNN